MSTLSTTNEELSAALTLPGSGTLHANPPSGLPEPNTVTVRPLKSIRGANERTFKLLKREKDVVLVEATSNQTGQRSSLEVAIIKAHKPHPKDEDGKNWDLVEGYPGNEMWGKLAWTWTHPEIAEAHFAFLVQHGRSEDFFGSEEYKNAKRCVRR